MGVSSHVSGLIFIYPFLALIMASAPPAADVASQSNELTSALHSGWPKVADAVMEAVAPGLPRTTEICQW